MTTGEKIKFWRVKRDLTQAELGERVGVARSMICQLERGTKALSLPMANEMADVFNCTIDDLLPDTKTAADKSTA